MNFENYSIGFKDNTPDVSGVITFLFVCLHGPDYKVRKNAVPIRNNRF